MSSAKIGSTDWQFEARPGGWWIATRRREDGTTERRRLRMALDGERLSVLIAGADGRAWFGRMKKTGRATASKPGTAVAGAVGAETVDDSYWQAQFPGKIRKVLVRPGSEVTAGETLLLLEAMKMEFALKAPCSGKVDRVLVQEGQQLLPGDRMLEFTANE